MPRVRVVEAIIIWVGHAVEVPVGEPGLVGVEAHEPGRVQGVGDVGAEHSLELGRGEIVKGLLLAVDVDLREVRVVTGPESLGMFVACVHDVAGRSAEGRDVLELRGHGPEHQVPHGALADGVDEDLGIPGAPAVVTALLQATHRFVEARVLPSCPTTRYPCHLESPVVSLLLRIAVQDEARRELVPPPFGQQVHGPGHDRPVPVLVRLPLLPQPVVADPVVGQELLGVVAGGVERPGDRLGAPDGVDEGVPLGDVRAVVVARAGIRLVERHRLVV